MILPADQLAFLADLARHNDKAWFTENKERHDALRASLLALVMELEPAVRKLSPHFVVDARPSGGSLSRIYRDTRFSRDKTPYHEHLWAHFRHRDGGKAPAPGFYMRIQPGQSRVGAGIWHPDAAQLQAIRTAMVEDPRAWKAATTPRGTRDVELMDGESLKKVPRGFDADHPLATDLRRKDLGLMVRVEDKELTRGDATAAIAGSMKHVAPFVRFICAALELDF